MRHFRRGGRPRDLGTATWCQPIPQSSGQPHGILARKLLHKLFGPVLLAADELSVAVPPEIPFPVNNSLLPRWGLVFPFYVVERLDPFDPESTPPAFCFQSCKGFQTTRPSIATIAQWKDPAQDELGPSTRVCLNQAQT